MGDVGAKALAQMLHTNDTLQKLILHDCAIGNTGMEYLANAFRLNERLEVLDVLENLNTKSFF